MATAKNPSLIALYSPAPQMGKSTATQLLTEGLGYKLVKFAAPGKAMVNIFLAQLGVDPHLRELMIEGNLKEKTLEDFGFEKLTPRYIMQTIGSEWGRGCIDTNLWTTIAARKVRKLLDAGLRVVIDDMRFPNELDLVRSMGGECWCILRPEVAYTGEHKSEGLLDRHPFDRMLVNDGTLDQFNERLLEAITRF
ncbi:MAG: hypothetical protein J0I48_10560 [Devosia sp.]|uniref:deoxynucleotide monophosphate kinase family protein n=1 Tax=Devosia sp. 66-22 TaxID=1895753 RepID=UPI001AD00C46|nr:hypothetical protein [Devosia sp. 66-22]MBN9346622.1 hypothetical protein [Devosia sp.]